MRNDEDMENDNNRDAKNDNDSERAFLALSLLKGPKRVACTLEAAASEGPDLTDSRITTSLSITHDRFSQIAARVVKKERDDVIREQKQVLNDAESALRKLANEGDQAKITPRELIGLEAIIVPDGTRPALFVQDDDVDPGVPEAGFWQTQISLMQTQISRVARSVGRIDTPIYRTGFGTGFVVAPGLIMTNRHVLEGIAKQLPDGSWQFRENSPSINFAGEFERHNSRSFQITGVKFAGPDPINQKLSLLKLDMALLTVSTDNGQDSFPDPLPVSINNKHLRQGSELYVLGFPAMPAAWAEEANVLMRVFRDEYFVKRFAPGYVLNQPDDIDDGGNYRVFTHDASTLGGNSGSCVVEFRIDGSAAVGLHFGGIRREQNYAHAIGRVKDMLDRYGIDWVNG